MKIKSNSAIKTIGVIVAGLASASNAMASWSCKGFFENSSTGDIVQVSTVCPSPVDFNTQDLECHCSPTYTTPPQLFVACDLSTFSTQEIVRLETTSTVSGSSHDWTLMGGVGTPSARCYLVNN